LHCAPHPRRRRGVSALAALRTDVARLPAPEPVDDAAARPTVSVVLLVDDTAITASALGDFDGAGSIDVTEVIAVLLGEGARAPSFATTVVPARSGASLAGGGGAGRATGAR